MGGKGWQGAVLTAFGARYHTVTVTAATDVTEHYRRLDFSSVGLLAGREVHPTMWVRVWFPEGDRVVQRAYTLVDADPVAGTFGLEFVLHDVDGPASIWARHARPGDTLEATVLGSKFTPPVSDVAGYALIGDTASLPAINSLLAALPSQAQVRLWLEVGHDDDRTLLVGGESAQVTWVRRDGDGSALVRELDRDAFDASGWYTWVATELRATRAIKSLLRQRYAVPRGHLHAQAYWVAGRAMGPSGSEQQREDRTGS